MIKICIQKLAMSNNLYSDCIRLDSIIEEKIFSIPQENEQSILLGSISDLILYIKKDFSMNQFLVDYEKELILPNRIYIKYDNYFISADDNKHLVTIMNDNNLIDLTFYLIIQVGGASMEHHGYRFTVHSNEDVHRFSPHVHVKRGKYSVRYSLETLECYSNDEGAELFRRDEKKIIIPFIEEHRSIFNKWWDLAIQGYKMPDLCDDGMYDYCDM